MATFLNKSSKRESSNFEITIDQYTYTIEYKFKFENAPYTFLKMKSKNNNNNKEVHFVITRSFSECGMWRLCVIEERFRKDKLGFRFYKGAHYTMSTFINLELQIYINENIDKIQKKEYDELDEDIKNKSFYFSDVDIRKRININVDEKYDHIEFDNIVINNRCYNENERCVYAFNIDDFEQLEISVFSDYYNYSTSIHNYHPVDAENLEYYKHLELEKKEREWPRINKNTTTTILFDESINYGDTSIQVGGKIYTTIIKKKTKILISR